MIPILYQENETNFNHNGIGILFDTMDYTVTEERNGPYELELVYPAGGRWAKELKDFRLISAKPNDEEDSHIFRIYETVKNLEEDTITVYAATKSNELGGNLVQDVSVTDVNAQQALNAIKAGLTQATSYNFISDIQTTSSGKWDNQSPLSAIVGSDGSVVSKWGGELKRTNDTIYLYGRRGTNKVTTIRQGKGLVGFKMTTSIKGLVTTILPYFTYTPSDSDTPVTIKGSLVNSSLMSNYPVRYISAVDFSQHNEILPTTEGLTPEQYSTQVLNNLNTVASAYFVYMNPGCDKPKVTIEVDLAQLSDSSEYEQFRKLEHIALTDTVVVWVEKFNVDVEVTINEVTYNGMSERVTKFVAGSAKSGIIQDSEKRYTEQIDKIVEYVNTVENGIYNSIRISADSKNNIFSGYTTPDESLVKFDDIWYKPVADGDIEMYRWDGDSWVLAVVNADRIAIGTLDANRINVVNLNASNLSTGTVTGASGGWNLVTGEFWLGSSKANSKFLWDGDSLTIKVGSGQTVEEYVSNAVNELEFGGRNLLKDSGRLVQNANYGMANYYFTVPPLAGEKVTITLKGLLAPTKSYFRIYNSGGTVSLVTLVDKGGGIYQATFDWVIGSSSNTYITVYAFTSAQTGTSRIDWIKLEKGNTPTDWSPAPEELYTGITRIDKDGVNVSKSTSDVNTQLAHDGLSIRDGDTPIAIFGEAGAVIPTIDSNVLNFGDKTGQYQVGSSHQFKSVTECLDYLFPRNNRIHIGEARGAQQADIWIDVNTEINETVRIIGLSGRGRLIIRIAANVKFNGNFELFGNLLPIYIIGGGSGATIKNPGTVTGYMIQASACAYVQVSGLNLDNNGGYYLSSTQHGSKLHFQSVDVVRANFMVEGDNNSSVAVINSKGNVTSGVLRLTEGAIGYLSGSIPAGGVEDYSTNKFVWKDGTVNRVASSYSPPAVTNKTFVQTFTGGIFDTLKHGTTTVSTYYGASAAQNRWDSSVGWVDGRIRFGSEVYNFFNGGSNISIRMRLRRKNSSHGSSGAVMPAPYNHSASFPSGATRGGWTGWATIPSSLFTSGGATLTYYNGVQGVNGYAIWDAIEVEVTVTKSV